MDKVKKKFTKPTVRIITAYDTDTELMYGGYLGGGGGILKGIDYGILSSSTGSGGGGGGGGLGGGSDIYDVELAKPVWLDF